MTGTAIEIQPVVEVDGRRIGGGGVGPVASRILQLFHEYARTHGTPIRGDAAVPAEMSTPR
jgi:branched-chain amino acid aminotransferase